MNHSFAIKNLDECQQLAVSIADACESPVVIELIGTLGAGKTQWTRYFVEAMQGDVNEVSSPTFVLVKKYQARFPIYHLDLYRIRDEDELLELGFEEIVDEPAIVLIEWADKFRDIMPREKLSIHLEVAPDNATRHATISAYGTTAEAILHSAQSRFNPN